MTHHPLCMTLWSGESGHCECPEANTCRACPNECKQCTWDNGTCECYVHEQPVTLDAVTGPAGEHLYLSTACLHGAHEHCRSTVAADGGVKVPGTCKFCSAVCQCTECDHGTGADT